MPLKLAKNRFKRDLIGEFIIKTLKQSLNSMLNVNASEFSFNPTIESSTKSMSNSEKYQIRKEVRQRRKQEEHGLIKFKTELCKSWCENGYCRYGDNCKFAHGLEEINRVDSVTKRQKNCKVFFSTGYCSYGVRCQFLHEHRNIN